MNRIASVLVVLAIGLGGCAAAPSPGREISTAADDRPPPPPRIETIPPAPAPQDFWVAGYWMLEAGTFVWETGRWIEPRPDEDFVQAHWARRIDEWHFYPAHWQPARPSSGIEVVTAPSPPPQPRIESATPPPGLEFIYVAGHYRLEHGQYVWVAGHWEHARSGEHWLSAHWVQRGSAWSYVPGRWEAD